MKFIILFISMLAFKSSFSQVKLSGTDSINAQSLIISKIKQSDDSVSLTLIHELSPDEAWYIVKIYLFRLYGKKSIKKKMPYYWGSYSNYYIFTGKKGKFKENGNTIQLGGNFTIIINKRTGCIIYLVHTK